MNYQRIYNEIIERSKFRGLDKKILEGYYERHHIVPKCLGGTNDKSNLVLLTGREHYLCHYLLWKIDKENQSLLYAFRMLMYCKTDAQQRYKINISSKQYEYLKSSIKRSDITKEKIRVSLLGKPGTFLGKCHTSETKLLIREKRRLQICSNETRERMSKASKGRITSEETKIKMRNSKIGKTTWIKGLKNPYSDAVIKRLKGSKIGNTNRGRRCIVDDMHFSCIKHAAVHFGISIFTAKKRFLSNETWLNWSFDS